MDTVEDTSDVQNVETGGSDPDTDKDYASFEAGNRRRRIVIITAAVVVGVVSIAALVATMGSIGKMSAQVEDAFTETPAAPAEKSKIEASAEKTEAEPPPAATEDPIPEQLEP